MNIDEHNNPHKALLAFYDVKGIEELASEHEGIESAFQTVDFFMLHHSSFISSGKGDFYAFAISLIDKANMYAPNTIKSYIGNTDVKVDYDLEKLDHALYVLAKGIFNGKEYQIKATSENKYNKSKYVFVCVGETSLKGYKKTREDKLDVEPSRLTEVAPEIKHPIQPLFIDPKGILRFRENEVVQFIKKQSIYDLNDLAWLDFSQNDREHFSQLHGYSLSGLGELSYVSDEVYSAANFMANNPELNHLQARYLDVSERIQNLKESLIEPVASLYRMHPDDLANDDDEEYSDEEFDLIVSKFKLGHPEKIENNNSTDEDDSETDDSPYFYLPEKNDLFLRPIQPVFESSEGLKFKPNRIAQLLFEESGYKFQELAEMDFPKEELEQFAQLCGFTLEYFKILFPESEETLKRVEFEMNDEDNAILREKYTELHNKLKNFKLHSQSLLADLYGKHVDSFKIDD